MLQSTCGSKSTMQEHKAHQLHEASLRRATLDSHASGQPHCFRRWQLSSGNLAWVHSRCNAQGPPRRFCSCCCAGLAAGAASGATAAQMAVRQVPAAWQALSFKMSRLAGSASTDPSLVRADASCSAACRQSCLRTGGLRAAAGCSLGSPPSCVEALAAASLISAHSCPGHTPWECVLDKRGLYRGHRPSPAWQDGMASRCQRRLGSNENIYTMPKWTLRAWT